MTVQEYQIQASRTCPDLGSVENNLFHMELGLLSEKGELVDIYKKKFAYNREIDIVHLKEELGDIAWYQANKDRFLNFEYKEDAINFEGIAQIESQEDITAHKDKVFKLWVSPFDLLDTSSVWAAIYITGKAYGIEFEDILQTNINKLQARYPEKFTQEAALNRDLETERKVLEGGSI